MTGVSAMSCGNEHSLILKSDGTLWASGLNSQGQLGEPMSYIQTNIFVQVMSGVSVMAAGDYHSLSAKNNGTLWATGYNHDGELGTGYYGNGYAWTLIW